jgi:hypothetical protein
MSRARSGTADGIGEERAGRRPSGATREPGPGPMGPTTGASGCPSALEVLDDVLDGGDELPHVVGLDRDEGCHPQLVAAELAVGLRVDDAVLP